ncbi:MAG: transposase [Candidatus Cloacimonetes bacterium]|nr:transposase [Candidatus Cloacimonadota bacterium]MCF7813192.1 transposase [Candidatus Cloacimonadota bacterium]MCF7867640.1 transposase [Candidatus Cloacimonadota bacterium]MCF7883085.1 transposase [Candidatus Cloacimonadota bacterium]
MLISKVIGKFKMQSAKEINIIRETPGKRVWQRRYYDHIIRNQQDLNNTKHYIINNPKNWIGDDNFLEI